MPIPVTCAGCKKSYKVPDKFAGRAAKCNACGAALQIPKPQAAAPAKAEPDDDASRVAALFEEEFGEGAATAGPPRTKRCPSCGKLLETQAVLCVDCGYDYQQGRKMQVESGPARATDSDPAGAHASPYLAPQADGGIVSFEGQAARAYNLVRIGLMMIFWALIGTFAIGAWRVALAVLVGSGGEGLDLVLQWAISGLTIVSFIGRILCLWVPQGTGTKLRVIAAVVAEVIFMIAPVFFLLTAGNAEMPSTGAVLVLLVLVMLWALLPFIAAVLFVAFLRSLAIDLKRTSLREMADSIIMAMITAPVALFVLIVVFGVMAPRLPGQSMALIAVIFGGIMLGVAVWLIVALVKYAMLIWRLQTTLGRRL